MSASLSTRQRASLEAACCTVLAGQPGLDATIERVERLIARLADPRDRARLGLMLSALDRWWVNLLLGGRAGALARLPPEARAAVLARWAASPFGLLRAGFQALKRLACVAHYCWPQGGGSHPAWRAAGYPGPLPFPPELPAPLPTLALAGDTRLDCDVVVVGSGAGGGVAAGVLAQGGLDVVVLEKGPNPMTLQFSQIEGEMLQAWYLDGGLLMTSDGSMPILAGSCLGGGTVINYTTSLPLPQQVAEEWDALVGARLFAGPQWGTSLERVSRRLGLSTRWNTPGRRDALLERGCRALGWHIAEQPRNVAGCREGLECGYCGYGCRHGAKNSTERTYLRDAVAAGARVVVGCEVRRIQIAQGRATGVEALVSDDRGRRWLLTVRARAVVAACGALHTPALLARSGLQSPGLGRGLRLHPATAMVGVFPEPVEPWSGALQTRYSEQWADLEGGYGARFETAPVHFALPASGFGWAGARAFQDDLARLAHTSIVGVLLRDRDPGRVRVGRDGRPRAHYRLSRFDQAHARRALLGAAEVLAAAGAETLFTLHTPPVRVRTADAHWRRRLAEGADRLGYQPGRMAYISFHQMATAPLGGDRRRAVADLEGQTHAIRGLYLADASSFPTSSGVNPMLTIMAIADHVARGILERW